MKSIRAIVFVLFLISYAAIFQPCRAHDAKEEEQRERAHLLLMLDFLDGFIETPAPNWDLSWQESRGEADTRMLRQLERYYLLENGIVYAEKRPTDPVSIRWLGAALEWDRYNRIAPSVAEGMKTKQHLASYAADAARDEKWFARLEKIKSALLNDGDVSDLIKSDILLNNIWVRLDKYNKEQRRLGQSAAAVSDFSWLAESNEIIRIGENYPTARSSLFFQVGYLVLKALEKTDPVQFNDVISRAAKSPNADLARISANFRGELIRQKPIEVAFEAIDGRRFDAATLRGKVLLIEFRGITWCATCRTVEPIIEKIYEEHHEKGLEVVTITLEWTPNSREFVKKYLADKKIPFPTYFDGAAKSNPFVQQFNVYGVPTFFLVGPDGMIVGEYVGNPNSGMLELKQAIAEAVGRLGRKEDGVH